MIWFTNSTSIRSKFCSEYLLISLYENITTERMKIYRIWLFLMTELIAFKGSPRPIQALLHCIILIACHRLLLVLHVTTALASSAWAPYFFQCRANTQLTIIPLLFLLIAPYCISFMGFTKSYLWPKLTIIFCEHSLWLLFCFRSWRQFLDSLIRMLMASSMVCLDWWMLT